MPTSCRRNCAKANTNWPARRTGVVAFVDAMERFTGKQIVLEYSEHALSHSADAEAICYIQLNIKWRPLPRRGGRSHDIIQASPDGISARSTGRRRRTGTPRPDPLAFCDG